MPAYWSYQFEERKKKREKKKNYHYARRFSCRRLGKEEGELRVYE